jgi:broad specificity phosphatase PhoE
LTTLYLVRHAKPAAGYGDAMDPGLDETGEAQARRVAEDLRERLPHPLPVYTSPLRRCRETALPLAALWGVQPIVFPEVGELPSPPLGLAERQAWLRAGMASDWASLQATAPPESPDYGVWRSTLTGALCAMAGDVVIFSHFIAINAVVGAATGTDRVVSFRPDHASVTAMEVQDGRLAVRALGREVGSGEVASVLIGR